MEIWVNKVGGDSDSEFSIDVSNGILHVGHLRKAINQSVECAKAPERFGCGAVDIYMDASATAEFKLSARDTLLINDESVTIVTGVETLLVLYKISFSTPVTVVTYE